VPRFANALLVVVSRRRAAEQALVEIQAAVEIYRRLAAANPAAYEPTLARSLGVLQDLGGS
jgi:hypothetical protein